ncbi:hypothetical protein GCM10023328_29690 [Modestobacter marinus]|uniref:SAM-dependent methyltransferase n=1 Tax=Modestobacter marinus TaxID=477641 RepID=A0A846LW81_9ACTN|nr:class I SAM-dependent methyltransferase [Modestobacter marinus]NIH67699.1 SAM-dependent methyltransferase [Modestobacter marinus]GGL72029.1 hypothetical protein GCM10011589_30410 [Modestobacter marinus]
MPPSDPVSPEAVDRLLAAPPEDAAEQSPAAPQERPSLRGRAVARARRTARAAAARRLGAVYQRAAEPVNRRLELMVRDAVDGDPAVEQVRELASRGSLDEDRLRHRDEAERVTRVNLELLKGEVRHVQELLDELGMAFAPATGLAGAGARFAELREAVHGLERRMRSSAGPTDPGRSTGPAAPSTADAPEGAAAGSLPDRSDQLESTLFDYVGFERRFRGDPEEILTTLVDRYGDLLRDHQPVVDIGCGRGELLGRLSEQDVAVIGIEPDPGMAVEARERGIEVHEELAGPWLRSVPDHSLGSIITTHVLEHLQLDDLIEVLELAVTKLRPGGVFISETPNPASLIVLGNSYLLDPTHVRPLHPSLLAFLCETAGFRDVRLQFFSPATGYHLPRVDLSGHREAPDWAVELAGSVDQGFSRLNEVLFGPQDYAVVATTPPAAD